MIPQAFITEWGTKVPWKTNEQIEQDLVISRVLVEIFNDSFLSESLAFRGGTAIHKLFLQPQSRYSEDIDLVQVRSEPIKHTLKQLQKVLSFIGKSNVKQKKDNNTILYRFESESIPVQALRIKIEINCREHFSVLGWDKKSFEVHSSWFNGKCILTTYRLEELIGTKLRALYQRKKGRDLFDIWKFLLLAKADPELILTCYNEYMRFSLDKPLPTKKEFIMNIERKRKDPEFFGDTLALLRPDENYNQNEAIRLITQQLIEWM